MTSQLLIPCQQTNLVTELLPKSRYIESINARKVLSALDSVLYKCMLIGCLPIIEDYFKKTLYVEELENNIRKVLKSIIKNPKMQTIFNKMFLNKCENCTPLSFKFPDSITYFTKNVEWIKIPDHVSSNMASLLAILIRLRTTVFTNLITTPEDRKRQKKYLKQLHLHDKECQIKLDLLINQLDAINTEHNEEIRKTGFRVTHFKNIITNLEKYLAERMKQLTNDEEKKTLKIKQMNKEEEEKLQNILDNLTQTLTKTINENYEEEKSLRSQIYKKEAEIETTISKFDQEMITLQEEYDLLDEEYTDEKKILEDLEDRFQVLEEQYLEIMEEKRIAEEKRQWEEQKRKTMEQAVTTIQAFWRSYKTRKLPRSKRGRNKGKKK